MNNVPSDILKKNNFGMLFICGDYNSRCGCKISMMNGLLYSLREINMCMLNKRYNPKFDKLTCVYQPKDLESLLRMTTCSCVTIRVTSPAALINAMPELFQAASSGVPDHVLLSWKMPSHSSQAPTSSAAEAMQLNLMTNLTCRK